MQGRQRINRMPVHTRKLYAVSGELLPCDVQKLANAATERMFNKDVEPSGIKLPLLNVRLFLIVRAARIPDNVHSLHNASIPAIFETSTATATIDSSCSSYGCVSAVGRLTLCEEPQDWNDPVSHRGFTEVTDLMNVIAITAEADGQGSFLFESLTSPVYS